MHIGIDASRATVAKPTGTEHYAWRIINELLRRSNADRFSLYLRDDPPAGCFVAGPQVEQVVIPFPRLWTHLRLSVEMLVRAPDVLFVPAHVLPLIHPRRSVVTVMDLGYRYYPETHPWRDRLYLDWSTRWNARKAHAIITISAATRNDLIGHYGTDPEKITVVHPGIDETIRREEDPARIRQVAARYDLPGHYLLYIGTLHPRKNLVRLVRAYGHMLSAWLPTFGNPPGLVLAGKKGWLYDEIFAEIRSLGLESRVTFTGYVPQEDLIPLLSGADLFVFPSLFEGFGFPILEAMACCVPVITSNVSSLPEVAGDAALLVDPHDESGLARAITQALTDDALRTNLTVRGLERVASFTWTRCGSETMAVLQRAGGDQN